MKLTEAQRRRDLLQYYADENAKQVFSPALRRNEVRCRALVADGQLEVVGISVMWGDLYAITESGRRVLADMGEKK